MFGFKLFLLSTYLHVNGYKIPSNSDSYTIIKPKQIYKPSPNTHGKTNKMQTHNPGMGKGDCPSETQSLLLLRRGGQDPRCLPGLAKPLSSPPQGGDVTPLGWTHSVFSLSGGLCFSSLVRDSSNSGPRPPAMVNTAAGTGLHAAWLREEVVAEICQN